MILVSIIFQQHRSMDLLFISNPAQRFCTQSFHVLTTHTLTFMSDPSHCESELL